MTIVHQAPDALLHTARIALLGDMWGDRVYSKFAPDKVWESFNVWVVLRVPPSGGDNFDHRDRDWETIVI